MNYQNDMMELVWLLNAAGNGAFELKSLYNEFLRNKQRLSNLRTTLPALPLAYLENEIIVNLDILTELRGIIDDVITALDKHKAEVSHEL